MCCIAGFLFRLSPDSVQFDLPFCDFSVLEKMKKVPLFSLAIPVENSEVNTVVSRIVRLSLSTCSMNPELV